VLDKELNAPNGSVRVLPKANANGVAQITVRVEDSGPNSPAPNVNFINRTFNLTITPVNDDVQFVSTPSQFIEPLNLYTYNIEVVDVDGDPITLTVSSLPAWLTYTPGTNGKGTISGTPPAGTSGDFEIDVRGKDPTGEIVLGDFTLTVNSRPVVSPFTITTAEDAPYAFEGDEFEAGYEDADGNPLEEIEITDLPDPSKGRLTFNGAPVDVGMKILAADIQKLVYTPEPNSIASDTIRWKARDGFMLYSSTDTYVVITITPSNDAPVIRIPESYVLETDTLFYELGSEVAVFMSPLFEASDPDGDNISGAEIGFKRIAPFQYRSEHDVLIFEGTPKITGTYDELSGILTLNGIATAQEYADAIRSIKFNYVDAQELLLDTRSVYVTLSDVQGANSAQESRIITLIYTFSDLDIPNAFTPNGDQANETWKITSVNGTAQYDEAEIKVYNKRGLLLFETKGFEKQWDGVWNGELLPSDTYFYTIELNYNRVRYKGTVTILR
jgi:gliding motility-associated-like protein